MKERKNSVSLWFQYNQPNNKVHTSARFLIPTKNLASEQVKIKKIFISAHVFIRIHRFLYGANLVHNQLYSLSDTKVNKLYLFTIETYLQVVFLSSIIRFVRGNMLRLISFQNCPQMDCQQHRTVISQKRLDNWNQCAVARKKWIFNSSFSSLR